MANIQPGLLLRLVSASCVAARNAGQIIRDVMSKGQLGIVDKGDPRLKDLQTEADRSAQKLIVRRLYQVIGGKSLIWVGYPIWGRLLAPKRTELERPSTSQIEDNFKAFPTVT